MESSSPTPFQENPFPQKQPNNPFLDFFGIKTFQSKLFLALALGLILLMSSISYMVMPTSDFPVGERITLEYGESLGEVSLLLKEKNIIRSRLVFEFCAMSIGGEAGAQAGEYEFKEPLSSCGVARRIVSGLTGIPAARITFPEGLSVKEISVIASKELTHFKSDMFLAKAKSLEGYLFPETYFFSAEATEDDVIKAMKDEFTEKTKPLSSAIEKSGHSLSDIVIMASILEKEARTPEDQALVAGILWKRLSMGMRLQVDAPFLYLLGKTSAQLTQADLKMVSGYNTYTNKGLPVGPIGNPGLSALKAAINPKSSPYLYYLSDNDGGMHYAKTFEEHKANKVKYLAR